MKCYFSLKKFIFFSVSKGSIIVAGGLGNTCKRIANNVEMLSEANKNFNLPKLPASINLCSFFIHDNSLMAFQTNTLVSDPRTGDEHSRCYQLTKGTWKEHCLTKCPREYASVVSTDKG